MIIEKIRIKNFRSIVDETIELNEFNCFVGRNDSGKSNVLKALNLFFNNYTEFNSSFDFDKDFSKYAKVGEHSAKEIEISVYVVIPSTYADNGVKVWTKKWRKEGLHSDNKDQLFGKRTKARVFLSRIQYHYIPAIKPANKCQQVNE